MTPGDGILIMSLVALCCWAVLHQQEQIDDMAEDIDLLLDGEADLVKAKRALRQRAGRDPERGNRL